MNFPQLTVECHPKKKAPRETIRGSATTDDRFAYFAPEASNSVYSYEWNTEQWNKLPSCPYYNCALVIIDGKLTTVGGYRSSCTNKLFTLQQRQWVEKYPPMSTARSHPAVVSTSGGDYIIVIGGHGDDWTVNVELFQVKTRIWYELINVPVTQDILFPSVAICGNQLHVIGWNDNIGFSCSISTLPFSDEPITPQSIPNLISWTSLPCLPVTVSTATTLCRQLVIIGGEQAGSEPTNSIHQLVDGEWVKISSMSSARKMCLVVSPSPDRMIIMGGWGSPESVEECVVV